MLTYLVGFSIADAKSYGIFKMKYKIVFIFQATFFNNFKSSHAKQCPLIGYSFKYEPNNFFHNS